MRSTVTPALRRFAAPVVVLTLIAAPSCGGSDNGGGGTPENAGGSCTNADQCYEIVNRDQIKGAIECLTQVSGGYCTHLCTQDSDCCAVSGECLTNHPEVCGPFESTGTTYCFVSCADNIVGTQDPSVYCQTFANPTFTCRSTGGGSTNEKICAP